MLEKFYEILVVVFENVRRNFEKTVKKPHKT